jgi:hypothetical protein
MEQLSPPPLALPVVFGRHLSPWASMLAGDGIRKAMPAVLLLCCAVLCCAVLCRAVRRSGT